MAHRTLVIPACDGYALAATSFEPDENLTETVVVISSATAVPRRYYAPFAEFLTQQGYRVVTYDYRGIGESRPLSLRGFDASARDWTLHDMAGVVEWADSTYRPQRLFWVGHSYGGQTVGLLSNSERIDALVTVSSQSGHWRLQGGNQKMTTAFHMYVTLPALSHLFGYMPWSKIGSAEDLPKGVALEWARWCRQRGYLLDDATLPLERYQSFKAPVLAYSFDDDNWGTAQAVDAMMKAYPNLTRRHVSPADVGLESIGHFGFFRPQSASLWQEVVDWLKQITVPMQGATEEHGAAT